MRARDPRPLVLDTNALVDAGFLHFLRSYRRPKILPSVAMMEIARLYEERGWSPSRLLSLLSAHGVEVEAFEREHAIATAFRGISSAAWRERLTDHMIGSHVEGDRVLVTSNVRDFRQLDPKSVMTPEAVMRAWGRK